MGFFSNLFGNSKESAETQEQQKEKNFDILKFDGLKAQKMGKIPYSVRCFTEALALKEDFSTRLYLAQSYIIQQEYALALEQLHKMSELQPDNVDTYLIMAKVADQQQDWSTLNEACQKAAQVDGNRADIHYYFGKACYGLKDELSAIAMLTKALALDENLQAAYLLRCEVLTHMRQYKEAEKDIDHLLVTEPENESYLLHKADLRARQGDAAQAIELYKQLTVLNPFLDEAYLAGSELLISSGQPEQALTLLNEAIDINPDFAAAYKARGNVKQLTGDKAGAVEDLKKALELAPQEGEEVSGNFSNVEQKMNKQYRTNNPFGF